MWLSTQWHCAYIRFLGLRRTSKRRYFADATQLLGVGTIGVILGMVWGSWARIDTYLTTNSFAVIPQLSIAIGAAIAGLLAIVFSLTLFTVQQASDRGTPTIFREFSRDPGLWAIYFALAVFAVLCFAAALLPMRTNFVTIAVLSVLILMCLAFVLLLIHFRRVVTLVSPLGIVQRFHRRGLRQLRHVKSMEDSLLKGGAIRSRQ